MKFNKHVPHEHQEILIKQLKEYEHSFADMTREERHLLHMWVKKGNSPYDNGDNVCDDWCRPMDFVNTLRFWADMQKYYDSLSEEEQREFRGDKEPETVIIPEDPYKDGFEIPLELWQKIENEVQF